MVRVRSKTVEPVIGTLINFTNMKRVNTRGIKNANKHVLISSLTYNLKKYLRFVVKKPTIEIQRMKLKVSKAAILCKTYLYEPITRFLDCLIPLNNYETKKNNLL
jgi:ABC-type anion transport system duplicated permease subunit